MNFIDSIYALAASVMADVDQGKALYEMNCACLRCTEKECSEQQVPWSDLTDDQREFWVLTAMNFRGPNIVGGPL